MNCQEIINIQTTTYLRNIYSHTYIWCGFCLLTGITNYGCRIRMFDNGMENTHAWITMLCTCTQQNYRQNAVHGISCYTHIWAINITVQWRYVVEYTIKHDLWLCASQLRISCPQPSILSISKVSWHLPSIRLATCRTWRYPSILFSLHLALYMIWASCEILIIAGCACTGNPGNVFATAA